MITGRAWEYLALLLFLVSFLCASVTLFLWSPYFRFPEQILLELLHWVLRTGQGGSSQAQDMSWPYSTKLGPKNSSSFVVATVVVVVVYNSGISNYFTEIKLCFFQHRWRAPRLPYANQTGEWGKPYTDDDKQARLVIIWKLTDQLFMFFDSESYL